MNASRWTVTLSCGCTAELGGNPAPGGYVTCTSSIRHQATYRILSAVPVPRVPGPGEIGVQGELRDDVTGVAA